MLTELSVRDLGVIEEVTIGFGPGMTALTGETGAGKTLLVEALGLLLGGRADPVLVRPGAQEALVEGRFSDGDDEVVLARSVGAERRSRAWVDTRMAPVGVLAERAARLAELYGQHSQQGLLSPAGQRRALDAYGAVYTSGLQGALSALRSIERALRAVGGSGSERRKEEALLAHEAAEIERAQIQGPDEDERLGAEEERLAGAAGYREAAWGALAALGGAPGETAAPGGAGLSAADALGRALSVLAAAARRADGGPLQELRGRVSALAAEVADVATEARVLAEALEDDPERLAEVQRRRQLLADLRRKYGPSLREVIEHGSRARQRLEELRSAEARRAALEAERDAAAAAVAQEESAVGAARRAAAGEMARAVEAQLRLLGMPAARLAVGVAGAAGDEVEILLSANAGEPALPLARVASGGELSRVMLAIRLVTTTTGGLGDTGGARTLVFDEVDAGIGGEAALAVGRALAALAAGYQVLVVTHLPQVAAFADRQVVVRKEESGGRTVSTAAAVEGEERVVELSRMLSGQPLSTVAREHARELLAMASECRASRAASRAT